MELIKDLPIEQQREHRNKLAYRRIRESMNRAKSWIRDADESAAMFEDTFSQHLARSNWPMEQDWYKKLPEWSKSEIRGYSDAIREYGKYKRYKGVVGFAHLYHGFLYKSYDHWRLRNPEASGSDLSDTCVQVYPSGKVYYAGERSKDLEGTIWPFAE